MTKKRFDLVCESNVEWLMQGNLLLPIRDNNTGKKITLKQCHDLLNSLEEEVFKMEQIIKTGKMPVENKEVLILIAKELYYLITHKGSSDLEEIVKLKNKISELEDME